MTVRDLPRDSVILVEGFQVSGERISALPAIPDLGKSVYRVRQPDHPSFGMTDQYSYRSHLCSLSTQSTT